MPVDQPILTTQGDRFSCKLAAGEFVVSVELIPGRGSYEEAQKALIHTAEQLWDTGRIDAISLTDAPGGNPALAAEVIAQELKDLGITALVHLTCKDRNRNELQAQLYGMQRNGLTHVLAMTGDYPVSGYEGSAKPVFDIDSVHLLELISAMNVGEAYRERGRDKHLVPTSFFAGAVVSPFKWTEGELLPQYYKLEKKIAAGARYIITQLGYDARKFEELVWYTKDRGYTTPLIANIYLPTVSVARAMNALRVAGAWVSDEFFQIIEAESQAPDGGKQARLQRAAQMIAVTKALGYQGVHLGGCNMDPQSVTWILDEADRLAPQWQEQLDNVCFGKPDGWYYYEHDEQGLLNKHVPAPQTEIRHDGAVQGNYKLSRFVHQLIFEPGKKLNPLFSRLMIAADKRQEQLGKQASHKIEHWSKTALYGCVDCGDCSLAHTAYVCPMSQCPKAQRNGPCGGSHDGWCEVYPYEWLCIFYRAYHRLKPRKEQTQLRDNMVAPQNWQLAQSSAWINYVCKRDNFARLTSRDEVLKTFKGKSQNNEACK